MRLGGHELYEVIWSRRYLNKKQSTDNVNPSSDLHNLLIVAL